ARCRSSSISVTRFFSLAVEPPRDRSTRVHERRRHGASADPRRVGDFVLAQVGDVAQDNRGPLPRGETGDEIPRFARRRRYDRLARNAPEQTLLDTRPPLTAPGLVQRDPVDVTARRAHAPDARP